jgi:hypothetical protein
MAYENTNRRECTNSLTTIRKGIRIFVYIRTFVGRRRL